MSSIQCPVCHSPFIPTDNDRKDFFLGELVDHKPVHEARGMAGVALHGILCPHCNYLMLFGQVPAKEGS